MSKTLSANVTAGKAGGYMAIYLIKLFYRISATGATGSLQLANIDTDDVLNWSGTQWLGNVIAKGGIGNIHQEVDIREGGSIAKISDFTLKLVNKNGVYYKDTLSAYDFENQQVQISIVFDGATSPGGQAPSTDSDVMLFDGIIETVTWDYNEIVFRCRCEDKLKNIELPQLTFDKNEFSNISDDLEGQPIPIYYGDHGGDTGEHVNKRLYADDNLTDFTKAIYVGKHPGSTANISELVLCGHDLTQIFAGGQRLNFIAGVGSTQNSVLFKHDEKLKGFLPLDCEGTIYPGSFAINGDGVLSYIFENAIIDIEQCYYLIPKLSRVSDGMTEENALKCINENKDDYTLFEYFDLAYYTFDLSDNDIEIPDNTFVYIRVKYQSVGAWETYLRVKLYYKGSYVREYLINPIPGQSGIIYYTGVLFNYLIPSDMEMFKDLVNVELKVGVFDNYPQQFNVYGITIHFYKDYDSQDNDYYVSHLGRPTPSSWYGGGLLWTPQQAVGTMLENPSYVIISLLRDELEIITDIINYTAFDTVRNERGSWALAGGITESKSCYDIIKIICKEFGIFHLIDYNNKHKLVCIRDSSPSTAIDETVMRIVGNNTTFRVNKAQMKDVYTEFFIHYRKHPATGEYEKIHFVKTPDVENYEPNFTSIYGDDGQIYWEKCRDAYKKYGSHLNRFEINCDWIKDGETAEDLLKWFVDWFTVRKLEVQFDTFLNALDLEIGDQRLIDHPSLPESISNTAPFMLTNWNINPEQNIIGTKWIQIPAGLI